MPVGARWCLWIQQVAGGVEGEDFFLVVVAGFEQAADRVVAVEGIATPQVIDVGELAAGVVGVVAQRYARGGAAPGQGLLL